MFSPVNLFSLLALVNTSFIRHNLFLLHTYVSIAAFFPIFLFLLSVSSEYSSYALHLKQSVSLHVPISSGSISFEYFHLNSSFVPSHC